MTDHVTKTDIPKLDGNNAQTENADPVAVGQMQCGEDVLGSRYGIDYGIDACVQTSAEVCRKCENNEELVRELLELLETIENSVAYTQALECDQNFIELVKHLDAIDAETVTPKNAALENISNKSNTVHRSAKSYIPSAQDTTLSHMNRFHPLQHVNNTHYDTFSTNLQPSMTQPLPLIPGPKLYSETVQGSQTTMIVTDSMCGGVKVKDIKKNITGKDGKILFKRFPGHTAEEISFYVQKPLNDKKPDNVIVVAGTNDLARDVYENESVDEFAVVESIMKIGRKARDHGAKKICISSVMVRRGYRYCDIVEKINNVLYMACIAEDFVFIDQADITMAHISSDGVHLNSHGTVILLRNILSVFDTFDENFIDFNDYKYAMSLS